MKQARLRLHQRINAIDAILDNTLLPAVAALGLLAFLLESFR